MCTRSPGSSSVPMQQVQTFLHLSQEEHPLTTVGSGSSPGGLPGMGQWAGRIRGKGDRGPRGRAARRLCKVLVLQGNRTT